MKRLIWIVLGVTAVMQAMLIANGYNELLQDKSINLGPSGPLEVQFHGDLYAAVGWSVIIALGAVIVAATFMRFYEALITVTFGIFFVGSLFQNDLPYPQVSLWVWGAGAAAVATGLVFVWSQLGLYRKKPAPTDASIFDRERVREDDLL